MKMVEYVAIAAGGVAVGIIAYHLYTQAKKKKNMNVKATLESCFGAPMHTTMLSMTEVRDWIRSREDKLNDGAKVVVLKVNSSTMQKLGKTIALDSDTEKNIVIAVVNEATQSIQDSILIRYEALENSLENALLKGNGILVVEA